MSARVVLPNGKEYHVSFHPNIGPDGQRDGLNFAFNGQWSDGRFWEAGPNASWFEDRDVSDTFCSELFADLTGKFPDQIEEYVLPNRDYAPFPESDP